MRVSIHDNSDTKQQHLPYYVRQPARPRQAHFFSRAEDTVGELVPIDFVNSVAGETGLPGKVVGKVDVRERHSFVDVSSEHANGIIAKLNRAEIKGHKVKVKVA